VTLRVIPAARVTVATNHVICFQVSKNLLTAVLSRQVTAVHATVSLLVHPVMKPLVTHVMKSVVMMFVVKNSHSANG
jgi:hypothetical protein